MLTAKTTIFLSLGSRERKWGVEWKSISFISLQESLLQFKLSLIYTVSLSLKCDHQDWLRDDKIETGGVKTIHFFGLSDGGMFLSKNSSFIMMKLQMYTKDCRHDEPDSSNIYFAANWLGCFAPLFLSSVLVLTSKQVNIFLWVLLFYRNKSNSSLYWNAAIGKRQKSPINTSSNNQQVLQCVLTLSAYQSKGRFFGTSRPKFSVLKDLHHCNGSCVCKLLKHTTGTGSITHNSAYNSSEHSRNWNWYSD
jgi:hypothetical protein